MKLEDQISRLAEVGITLNEGITVSQFLTSFDREKYEETPFDLILCVVGFELEEEPWGRYFSDRAWNFDVECIYETGDYAAIVKHFHRITGRKKGIESLVDHIDFDEDRASLIYVVDGKKREFNIKLDNDWADPEVVSVVMNDLKSDGFDFYAKDNGQASVWFYLNEKEAKALNDLADNVFRLNSKPWWKLW